MARLLVTLWFSVTALMGPGICCCRPGFVARASEPSVASPISQNLPIKRSCCHEDATPVRSCCGEVSDSAPPAPSCPHEKGNGAPKGPCPCKAWKQLGDLPGVVAGSSDELSGNADLPWALGVLSDLRVREPYFLAEIPPVCLSEPPLRLSGRLLLFVYQTLSC